MVPVPQLLDFYFVHVLGKRRSLPQTYADSSSVLTFRAASIPHPHFLQYWSPLSASMSLVQVLPQDPQAYSFTTAVDMFFFPPSTLVN
jgi:hypothetical protein